MFDAIGNPRTTIYVRVGRLYQDSIQTLTPLGQSEFLANNYNKFGEMEYKDGLFEDEIVLTQLMLAGF